MKVQDFFHSELLFLLRVKILLSAFQHLFHAFNKKFSQTNFICEYWLYSVNGSDIHISTNLYYETTYLCTDDSSNGYNPRTSILSDPTIRQKDELYIYIILLLALITDYHNFTSVSILFLTNLYLSFCRIFFLFLLQKLTMIVYFHTSLISL